jgi:hypothetical protein
MTRIAKHQFAGLAALASMLDIAMRALVESYTELHRESRPTDSPQSRSAADLVDLCGRLLAAIDQHRRLAARHLPEEDRWPF